MKHKDKVKLAKRLATKIDKDGKIHTPTTGLFLTPEWEARKKAIASRKIKNSKKI